MEKIVLNVEGMSCNHCVVGVTEALKPLPGVLNVVVDLGGKTVTVEHNGTATEDLIKSEIEAIGFDVI